MTDCWSGLDEAEGEDREFLLGKLREQVAAADLRRSAYKRRGRGMDGEHLSIVLPVFADVVRRVARQLDALPDGFRASEEQVVWLESLWGEAMGLAHAAEWLIAESKKAEGGGR